MDWLRYSNCIEVMKVSRITKAKNFIRYGLLLILLLITGLGVMLFPF